MSIRSIWAGLISLLCLHAMAWAQTPVDAGRLLEEQRRLEQQQAVPAQPREPLLRGADPSIAIDQAGTTLVTVKRFQLAGNTLLDDAALQAVLQPWLSRPLSLAGLRQAAATLEQAYREAGWLAHVSLPAQDVTDGALRFEIAEARMGRVRMAAPPAAAASAAEAESRATSLDTRVQALLDAQLQSGQPLSLPALERALLLADELPGVNVAGSLQAGTAPGSTDVLLQVARGPLARVDASLDNAANRSTGSERLNASLTLDSPWGRGEQLGLAASKTRGTDYLRAGASLPVGLTGWRIGVNGSALRYRVLDEFNTSTGLPPRGSSTSLGVEARYPLVLSGRAHWNATIGAEEKHQINKDDNLTAGDMQVTSRSRSRALSLGINGYAFDGLDGLGMGGQTQASAQLVAGHLSLAGSPESHLLGDRLIEDTQGAYQLLRWSASRLQPLTATLALAASASGQFASRNLDSNEKLYLGGLGGVNAYPSGEAGGSSGRLLNLELRQQFGAAWQLSGFFDWGQVRQYQNNRRADGNGPLVANNSVTLKGVGASLSWRSDNGVQLKATWAHRLGENPLMTAAGTDTDGSLHKNRLWLSASLHF